VEDTVARGQQPKIADPAPYPLTVSLPLTRPFPGATWHQEISVTDENCAQYAEQTKKIKHRQCCRARSGRSLLLRALP